MLVCIHMEVELDITGTYAKPVAIWALPYLATLPFDANKDRAGSKKWVLGAMEKVKTGQPVARTIGDTMMQLMGNPPLHYSLEIQHVGYERWAFAAIQAELEDD